MRITEESELNYQFYVQKYLTEKWKTRFWIAISLWLITLSFQIVTIISLLIKRAN